MIVDSIDKLRSINVRWIFILCFITVQEMTREPFFKIKSFYAIFSLDNIPPKFVSWARCMVVSYSYVSWVMISFLFLKPVKVFSAMKLNAIEDENGHCISSYSVYTRKRTKKKKRRWTINNHVIQAFIHFSHIIVLQKNKLWIHIMFIDWITCESSRIIIYLVSSYPVCMVLRGLPTTQAFPVSR